MSTNKKRLQELRGSGYEIAKNQPDIRGWEVRDSVGQLIGKVSELIFDSVAHKVRYMVVNIGDSKVLQLEKRTVLVPIGLAVLQPQDDDVILEGVTPFQLRALPRYTKDDLGARSERAIMEVFGKNSTLQSNITQTADDDVDSDFYNNEYFDENNMNRKRQPGAAMSAVDAERQQHIREEREKMDREAAEKEALRRKAFDESSVDPRHENTREAHLKPRLDGETEEEYTRRINRRDNSY